MKLISVECKKCGARLNLPVDQNRIVCRICSNTIILQTSPVSIPQQSFSAEQIAELRLELEQLDGRWEKLCEQNRYSTMYTDKSIGSKNDHIMLGIVGPIIGIIWLLSLNVFEISNPLLIGVGVVFILFTLHVSAKFSEHKSQYQDQFEDYSHRRMQLVALIESADLSPPQEPPRPRRKTEDESGPISDELPSTGKLSWSI